MHAFVGLITLIGRPESTCIVPATVGQHVGKLYMRPFLVFPDLVDANLHASASFYFRFQIRGDGIREKIRSHICQVGNSRSPTMPGLSELHQRPPPPSFLNSFSLLCLSVEFFGRRTLKWVEASQKELRHIKCPSEGQELCILVLRVCGTLWAQQMCIYCISCAL